jgi:hypothetical protein
MRERRVPLDSGRYIRADAFDEENSVVYEYDHPYWHGHPNMDLNKKHPVTGIKYGELYKKTCDRREEILNNGYVIIQTYGDGIIRKIYK